MVTHISLDAQARDEVLKENREAALKKLKDSHKKIQAARLVLQNLENEHKALLAEVEAGVS